MVWVTLFLLASQTIEQCVLREASEETGYTVTITGLVGIYSAPGRDPRFRSVSIVSGSEHGSNEGKPCWRSPSEVFGHMAFDSEDILKDYLSGKQHII